MNRRILKELNVNIHEDFDALEKLAFFEEREKTLKCIKGKPLSVQKEILKSYDELLCSFKKSN